MLLVLVILFTTKGSLELLQEPVAIDFLPMLVFFGVVFLITSIIKGILRKRLLLHLGVEEKDTVDEDPIWKLSAGAYVSGFLYCGALIYLLCVLINNIEADIALSGKLIIPLLIIGIIEILLFISSFKTMKNNLFYTLLVVFYIQAWVLNKGIALIAIIIGLITAVELAVFGIILAICGLFGGSKDD